MSTPKEQKPVMDADYFIRKFSAIPARKWCVGKYTDGEGRCCALGHCGSHLDDPDHDESAALRLVLKSGDSFWRIPSINDGEHPYYQQKTPRARILAALRDAKKAGR